MEPLTLSLVVIGVTQGVKLAFKELGNIEVKSIYTIVVAIIVAAAVTFINLESELINNIYQGVAAVGGLTAGVKVLGAIKK